MEKHFLIANSFLSDVHQVGNIQIQANPPWQKPSQTQNDDHVVPNSVNAKNPNS